MRGYSSAALRERIYINKEKNEGGILIYASNPGEDGTLGGLVSQVGNFQNIVENSLIKLDSCSNDPICSDNRIFNNFGNTKTCGAACYACLFLSETSCEFGNIGLDRNILLHNPPSP